VNKSQHLKTKTMSKTTENKITLTKNQIEAIENVKRFVQSDNDLFILKGAAGTGKTTVVKNIIENIKNSVTGIILLAPTNRAAKVLSNKTEIHSATVHSKIYKIEEIKNGDGIVITTKLIPRINGIFLEDVEEIEDLKTQNNLYIIDESSMLSGTANKGKMLISDNSILQDLYNHVKLYTPNNKILFVGDSYQLPPIGHNGVTPALQVEYLKENFSKKVIEFELTTILRQQNDSPILNLANEIKQRIDQNQTTYNLKIKDTFHNYQSFIQNFTENYSTDTPSKTIALGWSRKNVLQMNLDIREKLFNNKPNVFEIGDMLYVNSRWKTNTCEINKGEIGKVVEVIKDNGIHGNMLFHTLKIEFTDMDNTPVIIESKVLSDFAYTDIDLIPKEMFIKLAIERSKVNKLFKKTHNTIDDEYTNALQVKFAYALTVHKSQGGEWENVFIHANTNWRDLRWNYTAITRATKNIYSYVK